MHVECITHCVLESGIKIKPPPPKISRKSACANEAGDASLLCIVYHKMQMSRCWLHSYTNSYICLSFFVGENVHNIILSLNCFSVTEGQRWKPACKCSFSLLILELVMVNLSALWICVLVLEMEETYFSTHKCANMNTNRDNRQTMPLTTFGHNPF